MFHLPISILINLVGLAIECYGAVKIFNSAASRSKGEIIGMLQENFEAGDEGKIMSIASLFFTSSVSVQQGFRLLAAGIGLQLVAAIFSFFSFYRNFGIPW